LESVCPQLRETLRAALAKKRCVGHWICSTELRGLPAEVYLYLDAVTRGRRYPRASLVARRAHEEFLLENAEKTLFYFPPIQLVARIDFTAASPPWHVARPMVRMPRSHPAWRHPYTGNLRVDPFSRAELLGACGREAIVPASREARRLFPDLVRKTSRRDAQEKDLCLYGQERAVGQLIDRTCGRSWRRREVDVLTLVQGLWDLARVGLTRAHQVNGHMPRSTLGCGSMLYPLPSRDALANTRLARRVFPYNPWVPSG
jgi:hypothetical protein